MTRRLTRLADIAYRRRGRVVLLWVVAMVVIIGVGSSLAGDFNANYDTPGSESKAASDITKQRFGGYSGQEIYVVAKDPGRLRQRGRRRAAPPAILHPGREGRAHRGPHPIRLSANRQIATTTLPMTVPGWDFTKDQGKQLINAAEDNDGNGLELKLGGDPIYAAQSQSSPEGYGFLGAAIVLLIAFGSIVAAGTAPWNRPGRPRDLLGRAHSAAGQRDRRTRLDDRGLGPDRDRRRHRLLASRPHPLPLGDEGRQGSPRRRCRGRHDGRPQRADRRLHRGDRRAGSDADGAQLHVRGRDRDLPGGTHRDGRLDHAAARLPLLPRAEGRQPPHPVSRPRPAARSADDGRVTCRALEPHGAAAAVAGGDHRAGDPARAGGAGARHAPRVPRRGQRPARHDDPSGLRPEHRGLRARHERPGCGRRDALGSL